MKTQAYLVITDNGSVRVTKTKTSLKWNEIAVLLSIDLPDSLFQKPSLSADIKVDKDATVQKDISPEVISNIEEAITERTGIEIKLQIVEQ